MVKPIVLDTNIFVAGGFNPQSASARIISSVRHGHLRMLWTEATRAETEFIIRKIPRLSWEAVAGLFVEENHFTGEVQPEGFTHIPDPADRKFAALAAASGAILISSDDHLLGNRTQRTVRILTPGEFLELS